MENKKTNIYVTMETREKLKDLAKSKGMLMIGLIDILVEDEIKRMNKGK